MAVFLAAYALQPEALDPRLGERLGEILREAGDVRLVQTPHCQIAHVDLGLWPGASSLQLGGDTAMFAGDPVVEADGVELDRPQGLAWLAERLLAGPATAATQAHGTFSGLLHRGADRELLAITDKLGVRPIYWARCGGLVFVSSALWALERLDELDKTPDWRAAVESAAFGFPLGDRSPYLAVQLLAPGTMLRLRTDGVELQRYFDWAAIRPHGLQGQVLREQVQQAFARACAQRGRGQQEVMAFLSGGMDSRLLVSALRSGGHAVHSLNFAPEGSQDLVYGRLAAQSLGSSHFEYGAGEESFAVRQGQALRAWREAHPAVHARLRCPRLIWSGDGGSVGLGHVYLNQAIVDAARNRGLDAAAAMIQQANRSWVSPHIFRRASRPLADLPLRSIREDLAQRPEVEPGRNCHLFFMLNDQRRHLTRHYEQVHRHRIDLVLPFFDSRFLQVVIGAAVDPFVGHQLYNELLLSLPDGCGRIPWQSYPGHQPCPVELPESLRENLRAQWSDGWFDARALRRQRRAALRQRWQLLASCPETDQILNRPLLLGLNALALAGPARFDHLIEASRPFLRALRPGAAIDGL